MCWHERSPKRQFQARCLFALMKKIMKGKQCNQKENAEEGGRREISWMCVLLSKMQMSRPLGVLRTATTCVQSISTSQISYLSAGALVEQKLKIWAPVQPPVERDSKKHQKSISALFCIKGKPHSFPILRSGHHNRFHLSWHVARSLASMPFEQRPQVAF